MKQALYIALFLSCLAVLLSCQERSYQEIYYLPYGYTGPIITNFYQENGIEPEIINDTAFYYFPSNGIYNSKLRFLGKGHRQEGKYFYLNEESLAGNIPIETTMFTFKNTLIMDKKYIYNFGYQESDNSILFKRVTQITRICDYEDSLPKYEAQYGSINLLKFP